MQQEGSVNDICIRATTNMRDFILSKGFKLEYQRVVQCSLCSNLNNLMGTKNIPECPTCEGSNFYSEAKKVSIPLLDEYVLEGPKEYMFKELGHEYLDGKTKGNLKIVLEMTLPSGFEREGKNAIYRVQVSPLQAKFGGLVNFPSLVTHESYHKIPADFNDPEWKRRGDGLHTDGDPERGDIIYRFDFVEDAEEQALLENLAEVERQRAEEKQKAEVETAGRANDLKTLINDLLPAMDSLEKAKSAMTSPALDDHRLGIEMILEMQRSALARHGVEVIPAEGHRFDPEWHEAVAVDQGPADSKNMVTEVLLTGYKLSGRLMRASMVKVGG